MRRTLCLLFALAGTGCIGDTLLGRTNENDRNRLDAGVVPRTFDASVRPDAGRPDVGVPDAGMPEPQCECPAVPTTCRAVPVDTPFFSTDRAELQGRLLELVACAEQSLKIAIYEASWPCIVAAIQTRISIDPDLVVELVVDDDQCPTFEGHRMCALSELEDHPRVTIVDDQRSRYMHHKFVIADDRRVWVSSANMVQRSFCTDHNDAILVDQPEIVTAYRARFERLFVDREFGPTPPTLPAVGARYELYFGPESPQSSAPGWYRSLITSVQTASTSVDFMVFSFTRTDLSDAMIAAKNRGVRVRGLVSPGYVNDAPGTALRAAGVPVLKAPVHSKVMIIDGRTVVTGSPNWSNNAWENDEDSLWIHDSAIAARYLQQLEEIYATGQVP